MPAPRPPSETVPERECALSLRHSLLAWGCLRFVYPMYWFPVALNSTIQLYRQHYSFGVIFGDDPFLFLFKPLSLLIVLVGSFVQYCKGGKFLMGIAFVALISTVQLYREYDRHGMVLRYDPLLLVFEPLFLVTQVIESVMLETFIVSCYKKDYNNLRLYLIYCVVTFISYIIATSTFVIFETEYLNDLVKSYLLYLNMKLYDITPKFDGFGFMFFGGIVVDICQQILMIYLLNKLIVKNSSRDDGNWF